MTNKEFNNLKVGDVCIITKKMHKNFGKKGEVVYIYGDHAALRSLDDEPFIDTAMTAKLTVKHWASISIAK